MTGQVTSQVTDHVTGQVTFQALLGKETTLLAIIFLEVHRIKTVTDTKINNYNVPFDGV